MLEINKAEAKNTAFWDRYAQKYANNKISDAAGYENTINRVSELLGKTDNVLELGAGTGSTAIRLAPMCDKYLATDISPGMIAQGHAALSQQSPIGNLELAMATAGSLQAEIRSFDAILGFNYLHLVEDLPQTLSHAHNMLMPDGLLITKTPCMKEMSLFFRMAMNVALPIMQIFGKAPDNVGMLSKTELQTAIETAGFKIEAVEWHATTNKDPRPFIVARKE